MQSYVTGCQLNYCFYYFVFIAIKYFFSFTKIRSPKIVYVTLKSKA